MKTKNGDKITIKNIGKIAVDIPTFKHNFSYRLSGGESLVFPTNSVEQSLFYLKQKNKILQVTLGNGGEESLTPFTVGQNISAIKVDTNAKTNEELTAFVSQLDSGSGLDKAFMTYLAYGNERPIIGVQGSADFGYFINTTSNNAGDGLTWVSKAMNLDGVSFPSVGWYLANADTGSIEGVSGIVELQLGETITVNNIDGTFSELNGTVFGAVEGEAPTTTLTNIEVGQRLKGVKFDTSKTPDLSQFTMGEYGLCTLINSTDDKGTPQDAMFVVADLSTQGLGNGRAIAVIGTQIAYSEVEIADWSGQHIPQGWNTTYLDENGVGLFKESGVEPQEYVNVTEVLHGNLWNGIWAGAVEA